jgi:hypothetical protein
MLILLVRQPPKKPNPSLLSASKEKREVYEQQY